MAEAGLAGFSVLGWNGLMAPKGTPPAVIGKLNSAVQRGLDDGELRERLVAAGYEPAARNSPDDFARFIHADTAKWVALVEQTKMKGQWGLTRTRPAGVGPSLNGRSLQWTDERSFSAWAALPPASGRPLMRNLYQARSRRG